MKNFNLLVEVIREKIIEVGIENIRDACCVEDRHEMGLSSYITSRNHIIYFDFDFADIGHGFSIENVVFFKNDSLPNIINKLNKINI